MSFLNPHSWPHAILHFDGDAFFTSVEQALHPDLKGRPVVTGKERGIIACASYEAKALGIKRGIALHEAIRNCPSLVVLPSDYETYSLYSKRMFDIVRRYTPMVEEYSVDEGFADLTGLRRVFHASYEEIARRIQAEIHAELNITVSMGLGTSKSLAKLASKYRKPAGFTIVESGEAIHDFLRKTSLEKVWGFGPNTVQLLAKQGLTCANDFIARPVEWAERLLGKIGRELWHELRGEPAYPVATEAKSPTCSISKCKTFTSVSSDPEFIWAKLVRNVESALIKARRHRLRAGGVAIILRRGNYRQVGLETRLNRTTSATHELLPVVRILFNELFERGADYRATMVVLGRLEPESSLQYELFEDPVRADRLERLNTAMDTVNTLLGKHTVKLGTGLFLDRHRRTARDDQPVRKSTLLPGETTRQRLRLPRLFMKV
jgi:DNA polymerase IV